MKPERERERGKELKRAKQGEGSREREVLDG